MKIATFEYTDAKGNKTNRVVAVATTPSASLMGTDLGELTETEIGQYIAERNRIELEYKEQLQRLESVFDLKHRFRNFLERNITNLNIENHD